MTEKEVQTDGRKKLKKDTATEANQTDSHLYLVYASNLFYNELHESLKEEVSQAESKNLKLLLEKSGHMIERLKFKSETGVLRSLPLQEEK